MGEFSQLQVWRDPGIAGALAWYRQVAENRMPAKFRIAATIPVVLAPGRRAGGGAVARARASDPAVPGALGRDS